MKNARWAAILGAAVILAFVPAASASESAPRAAAGTLPRLASAKQSSAPASARPAPSATLPGLVGDSAGTPAERMADSIAAYYASGELRLY
ncbi:MAG: hypothetical protein ACM31I_00135 [Deltaproteobacteria bacterium]